VPWNRETFERLIARPPEMLASRFEVSHGMVVSALQREGVCDRPGGGYRELIELIGRSHESEAIKARLRRRTAMLFRSLRRAGIVRIVREPGAPRLELHLSEDLQSDFSLHHTLSLYLVEAVSALDPDAPTYPLQVLTLIESILENPRPILIEQTRKRRQELLAQLKAEGVPYEERMQQLEQVSHPKPDADLVYATFQAFADQHPWVREEDVQPKSIAREMFEGCWGFVDYARQYNAGRSEGILLRHLSQVHNTLVKTVPEGARTDEVYDVIAFLRTLLQGVDSSLVETWEALLHPQEREARAEGARAAPPFDLALHERVLAARVRSEMHALVRALASGAFDEATGCVRQDPGDPWDAARFQRALAPFLEEYQYLVFTPEARQSHRTLLRRTTDRTWDVFQVLLDSRGDNMWAIEGAVDLEGERDPAGPLVRLRRIGT
jgi:hypothetical protein